MLKVEAINAFYGKAQILFNLSLEVSEGEVAVLLGRNGAGKTTSLKSIMGMIPVSRGRTTFRKKRIDNLPPYKICGLGLGYVPENRRIFSRLTIMENLEVAKQSPRKGSKPWTPERLFKLFPNLGEKPGQYGGNLSGGEQQMLTIARSLMGNPDFLLLDEPSEGLAPLIVKVLGEFIEVIKKEGMTVLLSEQNTKFAFKHADRAYVLDNGSIKYEGSTTELEQNEEIKKRYLAV
jgi:branched-chain amino acid transport system ATP-binding protein